MGFLDGILGQLTGNGEGDTEGVVANLAAKVGLTPEQAESAIGALANAHSQPGDTVQTASNDTGISQDIMQQVLGHLGGEGGLAGIASTILGGSAPSGSGQDGDNQDSGQNEEGLGGMLSGLAGKFLGRS